MRAGILTVATGRYKQFVRPLYESVSKNFLRGHDRTFILFTDDTEAMSSVADGLECSLEMFKIERKGFPGDTLYRYHYFESARKRLRSMGDLCPDALFYMDADMLVVDTVGDEVLPTNFKSLIGTAHPGYYSRPGHNPLGTPETNPRSTAYIPPDRWRPCYWAGGFNGGDFESFMNMSSIIVQKVNEDTQNGITAVWHDESHLNAYLSDRSTVESVNTLTPSYCYPESWSLPFKKKIIALDKNHSQVRSL